MPQIIVFNHHGDEHADKSCTSKKNLLLFEAFFLIYIFDTVTVTLSLQQCLFEEVTLENTHRLVYL